MIARRIIHAITAWWQDRPTQRRLDKLKAQGSSLKAGSKSPEQRATPRSFTPSTRNSNPQPLNSSDWSRGGLRDHRGHPHPKEKEHEPR